MIEVDDGYPIQEYNEITKLEVLADITPTDNLLHTFNIS